MERFVNLTNGLYSGPTYKKLKIARTKKNKIAEKNLVQGETGVILIPLDEDNCTSRWFWPLKNPNSAATPSASASCSTKTPKRFEIKKWNAVALWAWGIILWISASSAKLASATSQECIVAWGVCNHAFHFHCLYHPSKHVKCVH
ncbi:hypothetical protein H5410_019179 [Solanum commersonii]|uniref:Uncharacterized protein n=1 Tax=Solanum commersonii TaxID=4109 RepID=A0A9J6A4Y9_SOLCO|nr:hypothetical protein H5410_019179 [Solanum commersonii]